MTEITSIGIDVGLTASEKRHLGALERKIANGLQTFREVGAALLEIRDSRLYRETHATFEAYCSEKWAMPRQRAYQLIDSARVMQTLGDPDDLKNESQARELASLPPETAKQVWATVEERVEETGEAITAPLIRRVRAEVLTPNSSNDPAPTLSATERLVQDFVRLGNTYQRWKGEEHNRVETRMVRDARQKLIAILTP